MPRALIIGCHGQDGRLLSAFLHAAGYEVSGIGRAGACGRLLAGFPAFDITRAEMVNALVCATVPHEIYYLAAYHHSSEGAPPDEADLFRTSFSVNTLGVVNLLGAMQAHAPGSRLFYAGSSHVFGEPVNPLQDETTPFNPVCAYGISKCAGIQACRHYRRYSRLHVSVGLLYNHESCLRPPHFISRKVVQAAVGISRGLQDKIIVGDLDALTDWGYAPDYVEAMWRILQVRDPDDFVIATGVLHSVRDLVQTAFDVVGLDWREFVVVDPRVIKKRRSGTLCGNINKINRIIGWRPQTSFRQMLEQMIKAEFAYEPRADTAIHSDLQ